MRDIDISGYVPPFLLKYKELEQVYNTENIEFKELDTETDNFWDNQFIESTNEKGVARYERMLAIYNIDGTPLRDRRLKVAAKWVDDIPYTMGTLKERLDEFCGKGNYTLNANFDEYELEITVRFSSSVKLEELEHMILYMVPANIHVTLRNSLEYVAQATLYGAATNAISKEIEIN